MIDKTESSTPSSPPTISTNRIFKEKSIRLRLLAVLLLSLLPILSAGIIIFSFLASPLRFVQAEKTGPTLSSRQIGQQFTLEHPGLRAITVFLPDTWENVSSGLNLHLRRFGDTRDLRFSDKRQSGKQKGEIRFEFVPLEEPSKGEALSFLLENGGNPFQLVWHEQNVYLGGQSFLDGKATGGDLTFELEYSPDSGELLGVYFERQAAYGGLAWSGLGAALLWMALALGGSAFVILRPAWFSAQNLRQTRGKHFLPVAFYFLLMGSSGMLAFMLTTPPLQGLDEQGHVGRTVFVYEYNSNPASYPALYTRVYELEKQARYSEYIPGFSYDVPEITFANLAPLSEHYQPPIYYAVAGGLLRLGSWLTGNHTLLFQMYMVRLASLLFGLATLVIALTWAWYLRKDAPWLLPVTPAVFTMLPTFLFISGVANNDNAVNFFSSLLVLGLTVLYKEGHPQRYNLTFWKKWWPVLIIALVSAGLDYYSKHSSGVFIGGLAFGVFVYFCYLLPKRIRLGVLAGSALVLLLAGVILLVKPPWQMQALTNFLAGTAEYNRSLTALRVSVLTFQSFWNSAGWVDFSDLGEGRLALTFFVVCMVALWGSIKFWRQHWRELKAGWKYQLALTLGLATLAHILFLILFRVLTTYGRSDRVIEFPQGRFFLLALLPLGVIFFAALRAAFPARLRPAFPAWIGYYLWFFGLTIYTLLMLFGGFLPFYYNQN